MKTANGYKTVLLEQFVIKLIHNRLSCASLIPSLSLPFALAWAKLKLRFGVAWRGGDARRKDSLPLKGGGAGWGSARCQRG